MLATVRIASARIKTFLLTAIALGVGCGGLRAEETDQPAELINPQGRTVSDSKQFIVFSKESAPRMKAARQFEDIKLSMRNTVRLNDEWKIPVLVNLEAEAPGRQRRPESSSISFHEGGGDSLRIQLDIFDPAFIDSADLEVEVIRALLLEISYREAPMRAGRTFQLPPDWLVEAIYERLRARRSGTKANIYSSLLAAESPPELRDFLRLRPTSLDSTSRTLYRAQSLALLEALLELPDGVRGLHAYISAPRRNPPTIEEIVSLFPSIAEDRSAIGRRWLLAIAKGSAANRADLLGSRETARELDRILEIKALPDPKNPEVGAMQGPYALEAIARSRNGRFILNQLSDELLRLSLRAHPMFQALVQDYLQVVRDLISRPRRRVDKRVAAAEEIRAGLRQQNSEVESFLDWVETTKIESANETLTIAIEEADTIEAPPPRPDAISRHLDALADRGW